MNNEIIPLVRQIVKTAKLAEGRLDGALSELNLTVTKLLTLRHLEQAAEPVSLGRIAQCMTFAKSNATQLIDHLEDAGLVRRVPSPDDRRCIQVELTDKGRRELESGSRAVRPLADKLESLYTRAERETFLEFLSRLSTAF